MFNQRKSFLKGKLFYIILLGLFAFGIWLNQSPAENNSPKDINADSNYPTSENNTQKQSNDIMDNIIGSDPEPTIGGIATPTDSNNPTEAADSGYYLVKEVAGAINVYFYNDEGKETLVKKTDIAFSLLSVADQALFKKGIIKHTAGELDELLQDFES